VSYEPPQEPLENVLLRAGRAIRWPFLMPFWAGQVLTGAKSFTSNPILGSRRLNALGLHVWRLELSHRLAWQRRARLAHLVSDADRAAFARDGFVLKRDFLPRDLFDALVAQAKAYRGPARENLQGDAVTRRIALDPAALARMPAARTVIESPEWSGLVRYVGSYNAAPLIYFQTILSHVADTGFVDPQLSLHADTFHPSVKAWFFLTDVALEEGPFTYVPGSHRLTPERIAWERDLSTALDDQEFLTRRGSPRIDAATQARLNLPAPQTFAVPANTLVVADTFGFHARGVSTRPSVRVELWAYGRRTPFLPWAGFDLWRIPALGLRRPNWFWSAADLLQKTGGRVNVWLPRRESGAFDPLGELPRYPGRRKWAWS
jgi:hypothetical protein